MDEASNGESAVKVEEEDEAVFWMFEFMLIDVTVAREVEAK